MKAHKWRALGDKKCEYRIIIEQKEDGLYEWALYPWNKKAPMCIGVPRHKLASEVKRSASRFAVKLFNRDTKIFISKEKEITQHDKYGRLEDYIEC